MRLKLTTAVFLAAAIPAMAQPAPPAGPKPTMADVQKVVKIVLADKAKSAMFCELATLDEQMALADEKKDAKKVEELGKKADALAQKMGPEYMTVMAGLSQIDPDTPEGKSFGAAMEPLDKLCGQK